MTQAKTTQPLRAEDAEEATSSFEEPQRNIAQRIWFNVKDCFTRCTNRCRDCLRSCCDPRRNCNQLSQRTNRGESNIYSDENNMWVNNDNMLAVTNEEICEIPTSQDSGHQTQGQQDLNNRNSGHRNSQQDENDTYGVVVNELPNELYCDNVELEPDTTSRNLLRTSIQPDSDHRTLVHQDLASSAQHSSGHEESYAPNLGRQSLSHDNKSHHKHSTGLQVKKSIQDSSQNDAGHHSSSHHDAAHHTSNHHDAGHHTSSHHDTDHHTSSQDSTDLYTSSCDSGGGADYGGNSDNCD